MSRCRCIDVSCNLRPWGRWQEGSSWMQGTKIQGSNFQSQTTASIKNGMNSFAGTFTMLQATPLRMVSFERRVILDAGHENSGFKPKDPFLASI